MKKYLTLFNSHAEYEQYVSGNFEKPNVSHCVQEDDVHYNPWTHADEYLTFVAKESSTFTFTPQSSNVINYSTDGGTTWTEGKSVSVNNGDEVMWKGTMTPSSNGIGKFGASGNFDVQGNIMSLLFGDNFKGQTDLTGKDYAFYNLFSGNTKVVNAENLSLPATTLVNNCYYHMFNGCTSLTAAPELPATTLANYCYCYMFSGCTNLVNAPELPATTLASSCYDHMFQNCTSLTTAPELPATTLAGSCYRYMFKGCTSLNYIKAMFTTTPSGSSPNYYTQNWVSGVASSGTFVKNSAATWNVSGVNGIPTGWTVETANT